MPSAINLLMKRHLRLRRATISASLAGVLAGLICALLAAVVSFLGLLDGAEQRTLDALFRARGARFPHHAIVLLTVDDATIARVDRWPLPRRVYARTVDELTRVGVRTIAFDIIFSTPSPSSQDDDAFAAACRRSGRVIQSAAFFVPAVNSPALPVSAHADSKDLLSRFYLQDRAVTVTERTAIWANSASPELQSSAPALGHVNVFPEHDGTLRRIPQVIGYRDEWYPSLALAAAAHYLGTRPNDIVIDDDVLSLKGSKSGPIEIPYDENGESWINWIGGNRSFPTYSLNDFLSGRVPPENLKDKLILIGATAAGTFEHQPTPFSPAQPGIEMQANAIDDILMRRPLHVLPGYWRDLILLLFPITIGALAAPRRLLGGLLWVIVLCLGLWQSAVSILNDANLYLPVAAPLMAGITTYGATLAISSRRALQSNWQADAAIELLARGATLLSSHQERSSVTEVVCDAAKAALRAQIVYLVFDGEGIEGALARELALEGRPVVWPLQQQSTDALERTPVIRGSRPVRHTLNEAFAAFYAAQQSQTDDLLERTIVAAPLPSVARAFDENAQPVEETGMLIAVGHLEGQKFTTRDATLCEALARQAALALENVAYANRLRSRVEASDRELREAYDVLTAQSARLAAAADSVDDALIVSGEDGRAIFVNGAAERILQDAAPKLGDDVAQVFREKGWDEIAALFERTESGSTPTELSEDGKLRLEVIRELGGANRRPRSVLTVQWTPLYGASGHEVVGAMLVLADVTAQRELDTMKSDFVAFVAHELRTPLTMILGYASLLHQDTGDFPLAQRIEISQTIMRHCSRLNRLITELLDVARLEAGRSLSLNYEPVDIVALGARVVNSQKTMAQDGDHAFYVESPEAVTIEGDADRIEQIFTNLISNAVKYSPEGGPVLLTIEDAEDHVLLRVSDQGMGMTLEQQAHLFQKYYRTPDAQSSGIKGTGLGLFLIKQLVEAHGGTIAVKSSKGQGTTFTVALPKVAQTEELGRRTGADRRGVERRTLVR
jgi:signal transduction histidine kinase